MNRRPASSPAIRAGGALASRTASRSPGSRVLGWLSHRGAPALGVICVLGVLGVSPAHADDRKFTYSYEAKTLPQGTWEFEQWATLQQAKDGGHWSTLLFSEEIEYGVTDRLNGSIYLNSKVQANSGVPGFDNEHSVGFLSMATEWKYRLTDPGIDPIGILLYEEPEFSNDRYEFETKLVLSKDVGSWTFAYNFTWEPEYNRASDPAQRPQWTWEHEFFNSLGVSYSFDSTLAVGVEAYDVARYDTFSHTSTRADYMGPNVHLSYGSWWATLTVLRQVSFGRGPDYTDDDNTKYAIRLIFGITF